MALTAATKAWTFTQLGTGLWIAKITLTGASQVSHYLPTGRYTRMSAHIFGTFNSTNVSLLGTNADPNVSAEAAAASAQVLHRLNDTTATFSAVAAEVFAGVLEVPAFIVAQSNGAVTSVVVSVLLKMDHR